MMLLLPCLLIGVVAGLRAMVAPAIVSWAVQQGAIPVGDGWLAVLGYHYTPWVFTALAAGELVTDQLPSTPSRKVPVQFGTRVVMGALTGAAIGAVGSMAIVGAVAGAIGAVIGTLGGAAARSRMAAAFGSDRPAALIEDVVAIGGALVIAFLLVPAWR